MLFRSVPVVLAYTTDAEKLAEYAAIFDGFLFSGGVDVNPVKYGEEKQFDSVEIDEPRDAFEEEIRYILRTLIEKGVGIELNTNRGNTPLPDAKWLKIYRELGGEIITLGSDAHSTGYVGCCIREGQQLLRECGFTRFCTFERMQPIWHEL